MPRDTDAKERLRQSLYQAVDALVDVIATAAPSTGPRKVAPLKVDDLSKQAAKTGMRKAGWLK